MSHSGTSLVNPEIIFNKISLGPGMRVADLGCGRTGHFVFPAAQRVGESGIVYAVEILKDIIENLKSRIRSDGFTNVETIWSDIEAVGKTPIPNGTLDASFLVNVLYMVKDKPAVLKEAARLVRRDAVVVLVDWKRKLGGIGPALDKIIKPEEAKRLGNAAGLTAFDELSLGDYHYCVIFKKI